MIKKYVRKFLSDLHESGGWKALLFHSSWSLTLTSGLSYFFGLVRDKVLAYQFGLSRTVDIYSASFTLPEALLSFFVGSALAAAFIPLFAKKHDQDKAAAHRYAHQMISWSLLVMVVVGALAAILLPHVPHWFVKGFSPAETEQWVRLTRLMLLSPLLFSLSNTLGQMLISRRDFLWYGLSPVLYNLGIIFGLLVLAPRFGLTGLVCGTLIGVLMHLGIRLIPLAWGAQGFRLRLDFSLSPEMRETARLMLPKMLHFGMNSLMLIQFSNLASDLPAGSVATYSYARNFQSLPVSLLGIAIATAIFPSLSRDAGKGDFAKFRLDFRKGRTRILLYTTLGALALALAGKPMIFVLLGGGEFTAENVAFLAKVLAVYCLSIPLESLMHLYHRGYYSLQNSAIPSLFHAANIGLSILVANLLAGPIGIYAIPVGFTVGLAVHLAMVMSLFPWFLKRTEKGVRLSPKLERAKKWIVLVIVVASLASAWVFIKGGKSSPGPEVVLSHVADPKEGNLRFYWKDEQGEHLGNYQSLIDHVKGKGQELRFAMNAGIFDAKFQPLGLYIEDGEMLHELNTEKDGFGNFFLQPNGVFYLTGQNEAGIATTDDFRLSSDIQYATQSGPMLLIGGEFNPELREDSENLHIRNGVGLLPDGKLVFAISKEKINFYHFARFFKELGCKEALYLDGFISKAYLPEKDWVELGGPFVGMIGETRGRLDTE